MIEGYIKMFGRLELLPALLLGLGFVLLIPSVYFFAKQKTAAALISLFLTALLTGCGIAVIDPFFHVWDEQFHVLVSKNLAESFPVPKLRPDAAVEYDPKSWVSNHIWLHKQPLTFWQTAVFIKVFGLNYFTARLPSVLMHSILIFPIFKMGKIAFNARTGFYAALIFALLNYPLALVAGVKTADHVDITFLFYITLSLWSWLEYVKTRKSYFLLFMGLFSGAAVLTKWLVGLLVYLGAAIITLTSAQLRSDKNHYLNLIKAFGITVLCAVPWQLWCYFNFREEFVHEMNFNSRHFFEVIENHAGGLDFYWQNIETIYGSGLVLKIIILLSVLFLLFKKENRSTKGFLFISVAAPYAFFTAAVTKMDSYLVIVIPVVLTAITGFIDFILGLLISRRKINSILFPAVCVIIALLLFRPHKVLRNHLLTNEKTISARKAKFIEPRDHILNTTFEPNEKVVLFRARHPELPEIHVRWMIHHDIVAVRHPAHHYNLNKLKSKGYSAYELQKNGEVKRIRL